LVASGSRAISSTSQERSRERKKNADETSNRRPPSYDSRDCSRK
jgi:hypothetical protein